MKVKTLSTCDAQEEGENKPKARAVKVKADTVLFLFDFLNENSSLKRGKISL